VCVGGGARGWAGGGPELLLRMSLTYQDVQAAAAVAGRVCHKQLTVCAAADI
jgi:hypothetical protein